MATTTNLDLTYLEVGQKDKSTTINTNMDLLDALPQYLGEAASDPAISGVSYGSTYYNTGSSKLKVLKTDDTWVDS
ncbi:MAG: hypothetical protein DRH08_06145 [Deltaproteobacteria bacterium]|nr:MAG: hypothetical protein DRH08_06145 [Deltaproteobacteria bacterium]